jgi:ATP-dependent helicase IRC3
MNSTDVSDFYREIDLTQARQLASRKPPAPHQHTALTKLHEWFNRNDHSPHAGGIVALPTGGGKTFTAVRFLCRGPLSSGYKVLWLAHTHHLLDQAYESFATRDATKVGKNGMEVGHIAEPKTRLALRVVSGTEGHFPVSTVKPTDDVVIITLQTMVRAFNSRHPMVEAFLREAGEKLFVVFDEAHHSPAPSYRKMLTELRKNHRRAFILGLTATPTYSDETKRGWLKKLFPQGIIHQVSARKLMADGILARPIIEKRSTDIVPRFDDREYEKWLGTYRDLPEDIISHLAENRDRNALIAETYVKDRRRYGKTIIFAERWYQCEQIRELLVKRGVNAGAVYSHVDATEATVEGRNKRNKGENARELEAFRNGKLDVLINVKMLTEGTDVPDVNTVFLTRQTTSDILLTQMVGRALRGPKFGGTDSAYIVSFVDSWRQSINWAEYDQLTEGPADDTEHERPKRPPLHLISIELVRRLARQMDSGLNVNPGPYTSLMPVGWYRTQFDVLMAGGEDVETVRDLVMVFEDDQKCYQKLVSLLSEADLTGFSGEDVVLSSVRPTIEGWKTKFFRDCAARESEELSRNLLDLARHVAQSDGELPAFFTFEERSSHDLDLVAGKFLADKLDRWSEQESLIAEYQRPDRYWQTLYWSFDLFKSQYDACVNFKMRGWNQPQPGSGYVGSSTESIPNREPSEEVKRQVKERDGYRCRCCGETNRRKLQIDHVTSSYLGGNNSLSNLQTLCSTCNRTKDVNQINFLIHRNGALNSPPGEVPTFELPEKSVARDSDEWSRFLRKSLNFFYKSAAVSDVHIGGRGINFYEWRITLCEGNDPEWLRPHLQNLVRRIQGRIGEARSDGCIVKRIVVGAPGSRDVAWPLRRTF